MFVCPFDAHCLKRLHGQVYKNFRPLRVKDFGDSSD